VILVIAEQRNDALSRTTWEAIAAAQLLAGSAAVKVVVLGAPGTRAAQEAATADVAGVIAAAHEQLATYTADGYATALTQVVQTASPAVVVFPHTYQTRDYAPLVAARLHRPLITDVVSVEGTGAGATFVRPMFQGKLVAHVRSRGTGPVLVSVQVGAFRADGARRGSGAPIEPAAVSLDAAAIRQKPEPPFQEAKQSVDLGQAERIVSVGRGIKSQDQLPVAERLASALGAEMAASRPICDSGWLPMERQVGSSGQTVAPKLYVALGISGAIQHLVGMKGSRTIVAINKDAEAPIFEVADYGIIGDLFEIVPALVAALEKN
jgi:electron transfer flavoprotein alpha subunit